MPSSAPVRRGTGDHEAAGCSDRRYTGFLGDRGLSGPAAVGRFGRAVQCHGRLALPGADGRDPGLVSQGVSRSPGDAAPGRPGGHRGADGGGGGDRHGPLPHDSGITVSAVLALGAGVLPVHADPGDGPDHPARGDGTTAEERITLSWTARSSRMRFRDTRGCSMAPISPDSRAAVRRWIARGLPLILAWT